MTKICQCESDTYPWLDSYGVFEDREEWLKHMVDNGLYQHHYEFEQAEISGEYYCCENCGDEIPQDDWKTFELIQKAMRHPFTEEAYYHEDFEMWMGDMPSKILLTPEAADLAWNEVKKDEMEHGVDYRYAKDYE